MPMKIIYGKQIIDDRAVFAGWIDIGNLSIAGGISIIQRVITSSACNIWLETIL